MLSSKVIYFIGVIVILGAVSDVALARPGKFEDELNRVDSEDFPEDYKAVLDIDEEIRDDKIEDEDEIIELVDNDAVEEVSDEDVEAHEIPGADEEDEETAAAENSGEEETDDEIAKKSSAEEEGKRHEDDEGKEDDDEIIEIEEEVLSEDQDEEDAEEAEAAWYEKIRQYFEKLGKK